MSLREAFSRGALSVAIVHLVRFDLTLGLILSNWSRTDDGRTCGRSACGRSSNRRWWSADIGRVEPPSSSLFIESRKQWNRRWRSMGIGRVESLSGSHFIGSRTESNRRWGSSVVVWVEQSSVSLRWIISAMRELECWPTRCFPSLFIGSLGSAKGWGRFLIALTTWTEGKRKWKKERK